MNDFYLFFIKGISSLSFYNKFSNTPKAVEDAVKTEKNESSNKVDKNIGDVSFAAEAITNFDSTDSVTVTPRTSLVNMAPSSYKSIEKQKSSNFDESKNNLLEDTVDSIGPCSLSDGAVDEKEAQMSKDFSNGVETCSESIKAAFEEFEYWEDDIRNYLYPEDDDPIIVPKRGISPGDINNVSFLNVNQ